MDVRLIQMEDAVNDFIEFFSMASKSMTEGEITEEQIQQTENILKTIKVIWLARRTVEIMAKEFGFDDGEEPT